MDSRQSPHYCHGSRILCDPALDLSACSMMTYGLEGRQTESEWMTGIRIDLRMKHMLLKLSIGVLGRIALLAVGIKEK